MSVEVYGLSRCKKTQKAVSWLKERNIGFNFHDFGREGIDREKLAGWMARVGYAKLLNTKSPIFRKVSLGSAKTVGVDAQASAQRLMQDEPRLINRPVLEYGSALVIGFEPESYGLLFPQLPLA